MTIEVKEARLFLFAINTHLLMERSHFSRWAVNIYCTSLNIGGDEQWCHLRVRSSWKQVGMMPWWDKDIIIQERRAEVSHSQKKQITWFCAVCLSEWPESMMHNMWCDSMSTHTNGPGLPPHSYSTDPCRTRLQRETQRERYLKATVHPFLHWVPHRLYFMCFM